MPTILKGFHRPLLPTLGLYKDKQLIKRRVTFNNSCRYSLEGVDQFDINKLFGIGYFPSHHWESARFGWRYDDFTGLINLYAYCYTNGTRRVSPLCSVHAEKTVDLWLNVSKYTYQFIVMDGKDRLAQVGLSRGDKRRWGFPLGFYFGGNRKAPHSITVKMKSL